MKKEDLKGLGLRSTGFCLLDAGMIIEALLTKNIHSVKAFKVVEVGHIYVIHENLKSGDKALHLNDSYPDFTVEEVLSVERLDATERCIDLVFHPEKRHTLDAILSII